MAASVRVLEPKIEASKPKSGALRVVSVEGFPLAHTGQVLGFGANLKEQIESALSNVDTALRDGGSDLSRAVKLNAYVRDDSATASVEAALDAKFKGASKPAVSLVTTRLPDAAALVAFDAVGAVEGAVGNAREAAQIHGRVGKACSVLPVGPRVYISGQAEKGDGTLADATQKTMASLGRTLSFLGLSTRDVIQVKSFLTPMERCAEAEKEIAAFFEGGSVPTCVFVEWKSSLPIEIELIASAPVLKEGSMVEVRTPPGMTMPAVYSRLTIARHPVTLYTSGLYPVDPKISPAEQLRSLFTHLKQCLDLGASDWMHLVKATYYVNDDELSKQHNIVRPDYFSPRRPPAASKATVVGTGREGYGITMDFIMVPGE